MARKTDKARMARVVRFNVDESAAKTELRKIQRAAKKSGVSFNKYMVDAALEKASK